MQPHFHVRIVKYHFAPTLFDHGKYEITHTNIKQHFSSLTWHRGMINSSKLDSSLQHSNFTQAAVTEV